MSKLIIGADFVPTDENKEFFIKGDVETLVGKDLMQILIAAEYSVFNLEVPLTDVETPIKKCGPNLIAPTKAILGYKALGVDILTLANNHIMDQGQRGLVSTCKVLKENNINYLGIGKTLEEAAKPYVINFHNKKVGIYACAEHEFSIVSANNAGANPFDPLETPDHIADLKAQCDYVIVLYHGGKEHYRYPSPNLQKICRKLVEKGANLVVCQHSHCIGCEEKYKDGTIVYGQGNFLFDHSKNECWKTGLLIEIDSAYNLSYIPIVKEENTVRLAKEDVAKNILMEFRERSEKILSTGFIEDEYKKLAKKILPTYLTAISGTKHSIFYRVINKLSNYRLGQMVVKIKYNNTKKTIVQNYIECEAHNELLLCGLKSSLAEVEKNEK